MTQPTTSYAFSLCLIFSICLLGCATSHFSNSLDKRITRAQTDTYHPGSTPHATKPYLGDKSVDAMLGRIEYVSPLRGRNIRLGINNSPEINAGTDGETIFLNRGLVESLGKDHEILAGVLAHELAHIIAGHHSHRGNRQGAFDVLSQAASFGLGFVPFGWAASFGVREGLDISDHSYSRAEEKEADVIGAILAYEAGYDPYGLSRFFEIADRIKGGFNLNASVPVSSNPWVYSQLGAQIVLHNTPLYRKHPGGAKRMKTVELVVKAKHGLISMEELREQDPQIAKIYEVIETRRPRN